MIEKIKHRKQKIYKVNVPFIALVGQEEASFPLTIQKFYNYLKEHNCQDSIDKRKYHLNSELKSLFHQNNSTGNIVNDTIYVKDIMGLVFRHILIK